MKRRYMVIDVELCFDCNNCFMACKDEHVDNSWLPYTDEQPRHGHRWMNILRRERGQYPRIDVAYLPLMCQQCEVPSCQQAYPECVTRREDGIVMIDAAKARGVKGLVDSCPYGAIYYNEEADVAQKCTMCAHLLDGGQEPCMPRCAHSCPTVAIEYLYVEPSEMARKIEQEGLEAYRVELGSRPSIFYKNLHRFDKAFLAGGLLKENECAQGVEVTLQGQGITAAQITDCFGDFKFDRLASGEYSLSVDGKEVQKVQVRASVNVGTLVM